MAIDTAAETVETDQLTVGQPAEKPGDWRKDFPDFPQTFQEAKAKLLKSPSRL